jgi:hypothetical protein
MESYPLCQLFSQPGSGHEPALFFKGPPIDPSMDGRVARASGSSQLVTGRQLAGPRLGKEDRHEIDRGHEFVYFDHCGEGERASNGGDTPL